MHSSPGQRMVVLSICNENISSLYLRTHIITPEGLYYKSILWNHIECLKTPTSKDYRLPMQLLTLSFFEIYIKVTAKFLFVNHNLNT